MSVEHWWNDADRKKPKYSGVKLSQLHVIHNKFCMDWSVNELRPPC